MGFRFVQRFNILMHNTSGLWLLYDFASNACGFKPAVLNNIRPTR